MLRALLAVLVVANVLFFVFTRGALGVGWLLLLLGAVVSLALTAARAGSAATGLSAAARDGRRR